MLLTRRIKNLRLNYITMKDFNHLKKLKSLSNYHPLFLQLKYKAIQTKKIIEENYFDRHGCHKIWICLQRLLKNLFQVLMDYPGLLKWKCIYHDKRRGRSIHIGRYNQQICILSVNYKLLILWGGEGSYIPRRVVHP